MDFLSILFANLERRNEKGVDEIKVAVDGLRVNRVVFLLLTSLSDDLDRLHAMILFVPPVDDPYLVQILHVGDINRVSIRHDNLKARGLVVRRRGYL